MGTKQTQTGDTTCSMCGLGGEPATVLIDIKKHYIMGVLVRRK